VNGDVFEDPQIYDPPIYSSKPCAPDSQSISIHVAYPVAPRIKIVTAFEMAPAPRLTYAENVNGPVPISKSDEAPSDNPPDAGELIDFGGKNVYTVEFDVLPIGVTVLW